MTKINVDNIKYNELIENIEAEYRLFNENIDLFFNEILKMEGWKGDKANEYIEKTLVEKTKYENFSNSLSITLNELSNILDSLESTISSFR